MAPTLSKTELETLMTASGDRCVSIFMPTHPAGPETKQDPIRLKKLLRAAEKDLGESGLRPRAIQERLQQAWALLELPGFWREQKDGLAIFIAPDMTRDYQLSIPVKRLLVIADRFHLKPLLPLFSGDGTFYILALSQNEIRLLRATQNEVRPVELENAPESMAEALPEDDVEKQVQWHSSTDAPGAPGRRAAAFFGQGAGAQDSKSALLRYFQQVDRGVRDKLAAEQAPLVLAGVDYLLPIYREVNSYPHLMEAGVLGNPELLRAEALQAQAWPIVEPLFQAAQHRAADRYQQLSGANSDMVSSDLRQIVPASVDGRVEALFVALGVEQWGAFDPTTYEVSTRESAQAGDQDLLDLAAIQAYLHGGAVFVVDADNVPGAGRLAAIFRY
jgi:hypothetical protein